MIETDISRLTDEDLISLQHHYAAVRSDIDLLVRYTTARGGGHGLTHTYAGCTEAILELGEELKRRKDGKMAQRKEMG